MDWFGQIDAYCERTDFSFWAEPVNALSNAAFLLAAFLVWRLTDARRDHGAMLLVWLLVSIGIGSFLFHTLAQRWTGLADVLPIMVFTLTYLYLATTRFLRPQWWAGALAVVAYVPFAFGIGALVRAGLGPMNGSAAYTPQVAALLLYAVLVWRRSSDTANGLLYGAGLLVLSLGFRTIDQGVCSDFPLGTHFLWHTLNGGLLGWMIVVLLRHGRNSGSGALAPEPAPR